MSFQFINRILQLPRITRIIITALIALATTLAITPIVDDLYIRWFLNESTRMLPWIISVTSGVLLYSIGYFLIVGTIGEQPQSSRLTRWYLTWGMIAGFLVFIWLFRLILSSIA